MKPKIFNAKKGIKRAIATAFAFCIAVAGLVTTKTEVYAAEMRDAWTITREMKAGWNLGNSLESEYEETYWGNPATTKGMIDKIREKGFSTLRIPVRWDDHYTDSNYTIDGSYMQRVKEVVDYGIDNGMYVIINVHHNDLQTKVSTEGWQQEQVKYELSRIWEQVGDYFKNYGDKLIFEVNNEPRQGEDWGGNDSLYECVNGYNEAALGAIRKTGGNNKERLVLLPTYCASSDEAKLLGWRKPNDDRIAVSIHAYVPFQFAYEGNLTQWNGSLHEELKSIFARYKKYFLDKGIPVVIGEFGATNMNNTYEREQCAAAYAGLGNDYNIPCILWDNNRFETGKENFGLFDRSSYTFVYDKLVENVINAYGGGSSSGSDDGGDPYKSVFWSESGAYASNWGQAVAELTEKHGGSFKSSDITPGGYFYVEYSGTEGEVEFILQCFSPDKWSKVAISEKGSANGHYFAKYSYDNCVAAFGTSDFNGMLDKINVGATSKEIKVYSVCYCHPR